MPDYRASHAIRIADPALPGKLQAGDEVAYLLVFVGGLTKINYPDQPPLPG